MLLLSRVGIQKLRDFFIKEWNAAGRFVQWTDCPQNGIDLLTMFKPLTYEVKKVQSGVTSSWDLSLFVKALLSSKPPFVPKAKKALSDGLKCLKDTRNILCHTANGKIGSTEFAKLYADACNALMLLGATPNDFQEVKKGMEPLHFFFVLKCLSLYFSQS